MNVDVVLRPADLRPSDLASRAVVVFDVLRATTSMTAALAAGAKEIRIFGDVASARAARASFDGPALLCGEENALPPSGFDLGNSPSQFVESICAGRTLFLSTTNGTRAILAARGASKILIGSIVNASATARALCSAGAAITLLCSGTNGQISLEDLLGCGAVLNAMEKLTPVIGQSDSVLMARDLFAAAGKDLPSIMRTSQGGRNVIRAGLAPDIDFAAKLDRFDMVGTVVGDPPVVIGGGGIC